MIKAYEISRINHELAPNILARANTDPNVIPGRMYVHATGIIDAFPYNRETTTSIEQALNHSLGVIRTFSQSDESRNTNYVLTLVWGNNGEPIVDLLKISGLDIKDRPENWPGNPDIEIHIYKNGVYQPKAKSICGDGGIVLADEEFRRRRRKNLREFLENPPLIRGLEFIQV
jgi:hypothetical protein